MKILYILLIIAAALLYPMYPDRLSFLLLSSLLILPLLLIVQLVIAAFSFECSFINNRVTLFKNDSGELKLRLKNGSVFPLGNVKTAIRIKTPSGERRYTASVPLPAKSEETVSIGIDGIHCTAVRIEVEYVRICDLLGLFSVKLFRKKLVGYASVVPEIKDEYSGDAMRLLLYGESMGGDDGILSKNGAPDEITGYREFMEGDRLSLIHYKLSARFDKDIVKVMSRSGSRRYLLGADMGICTDHDHRDRQLERIMSCAYYLNAENAQVYVLVPQTRSVDGIYTRGGFAACYSDDASYFSIASSLCTSTMPMPPDTDGFITCDLSIKDEGDADE